MPIRFLSGCLFSGLLGLAAVSPVLARAAQQTQAQPSQASSLDALSARAAGAIENAAKLPVSTSNVLVVDFVEAQGSPSQLGADLAREFSDSLSKHAWGFSVLDRAEYLKELSADKLSADSFKMPETVKCYAMEFGAVAVVAGSLDHVGDQVVARVQVERLADQKEIFDERISLPVTPEMQALASKPARIGAGPARPEGQGSDSGREPRPNGDADFDAPAAGTRGYTMPSCLYCPRAEFSEAALKAKFQGIVLLMVEIGANGTAKQVVVVRGAPCGLNQQAIDAVKGWKFKPANGPDGDPAAVRVPIEVLFKLY